MRTDRLSPLVPRVLCGFGIGFGIGRVWRNNCSALVRARGTSDVPLQGFETIIKAVRVGFNFFLIIKNANTMQRTCMYSRRFYRAIVVRLTASRIQ